MMMNDLFIVIDWTREYFIPVRLIVLSRFDFYPTASLSEPPEIEFSKNFDGGGSYHG